MSDVTDEAGGTVGLPAEQSFTHRWQPEDWSRFLAFDQECREPFSAFARLTLRSQVDAEEAVDRTFDELMDSWSGLADTRPNLIHHAWGVLKRHITIQARRRHAPRPVNPRFLDSSPGVSASAASSYDPELIERVQALVERLPERQRDAVSLRYGLDYSTREVAELMDISTDAVRSHLSQATTRLARLLKAADEERTNGKVRP
ncbi:RNA polymerase sigma factor FliA (plasmid) [Streptomyces xanthophaeus]|uniref:RNA polymerase sigma factor n=1 Tax=Streptomyces xanthophaeus TaxID=67385 RepID=UPI00233E8718|nr:sigma-70 family RNA polymerase sigma factor [Streptomyces xanthophaeus]WCD91198.1 RNA polymerase sigma factor FliA [Streptomyces xanthophaeus]